MAMFCLPESQIEKSIAGRKVSNVSQQAKQRQIALKRLADDYENRDTLVYLRGVSYNLKLSEIVDPEQSDADSGDED